MRPQRAVGSAFGFAVLGIAVSAGGILYEEAEMRTVLVAVGATFLLGAVLTYALGSERYLPAVVHESVYADMAENEAALIDTYDLQDTFVYVPHSGRNHTASLFIPRDPEFTVPAESELDSLFVSDFDGELRGLSLRPSGDRLHSHFEDMLGGEASDVPSQLGIQLADGLVEGFGLADRASPEVRPVDNAVEFVVDGCVCNPTTRPDDPAQSFLAVGLAAGLDVPVVADSRATDGDRHVIRCRWFENTEQRTREPLDFAVPDSTP
jgi:hypothetical protein